MSREKPSTTLPELTPAEQQDNEKRDRLRSALSRLAPEYQVYCDKIEEEGKGMPADRKEQFLEFITDLNPKYLEFLNIALEKKVG